jgi:hypothetical protein
LVTEIVSVGEEEDARATLLNNVRILESSANTISITLGEQNKELVAQIEVDERDLNGDPSNSDNVGKVKELYGYTQKKERKERGNGAKAVNLIYGWNGCGKTTFTRLFDAAAPEGAAEGVIEKSDLSCKSR